MPENRQKGGNTLGLPVCQKTGKKEAFMHEIIRKYAIDQEENKIFLKEIRENLLAFGHRFPSPAGDRKSVV